jgi:hypothetical protein
MTPAKAAALAAMQSARKGKRVHPEPPKAFARIAKALRKRKGASGLGADNGLSVREVAAEIRVSDRTLRRWLAGEDRPAPKYHAAIERIAR